jgi:hypothetical protein
MISYRVVQVEGQCDAGALGGPGKLRLPVYSQEHGARRTDNTTPLNMPRPAAFPEGPQPICLTLAVARISMRACSMVAARAPAPARHRFTKPD